MMISCEVLRESTKNWPKEDLYIIEKRIKGKYQVPILDVYKLFMPNHMRKILIQCGYHSLADKWNNFLHSSELLDKTKEDFSHELYVGLEDKALKIILEKNI